ncbi:MAG: hypothetical protein GPJ52_00710 [Candidatus Heimdallarchaeota archaeon]|nr:hypothetical protein [Candidatus Heimdallarchaeota archaeon]
MDSLRNNKLLFASNKKKRKTWLKVYTNGKICFAGPVNSYGIKVPARLKEWISFPTNRKENLTLTCDFIVNDTLTNDILYKDITSTMYFNGYCCYIKPRNYKEKQEIIFESKRKRKIVQCNFVLQKNNQVQVKELLYEVNKIVEPISLSVIRKSKPLIAFNYKSKEVSIYQDHQGFIYIKATGRLDKFGDFRINNYVEYFIEDWFTTEEYYYASLNGKEAIVVPSKNQSRKRRGGDITKSLNFPYYGNVQEVEVVFSSPTMKFTEKAEEVISTKILLEEAQVPIKGLLPNVWKTEQHKDKVFADSIKTMLQQLSKTTQTILHSSEALIEIETKQDNTLGLKHCFDHLIINTQESKPIIYFCETISSLTSSNRQRILVEEVAQLYYFSKLFGKNCFSILFANDDFTSDDSETALNYYSLASSVLILDRNQINKCITHPEDFLCIVKEFHNKITKMHKNPENTIHPITTEIVAITQLHNEAFKILKGMFTEVKPNTATIPTYCKLMGITQKDFHFLYKKGIQKKNHNKYLKMFTTDNQSTLLVNKNTNFILTKHISGLLYIHYTLVEEQAIALVTKKQTLSSLLPVQKKLKLKLPPTIKIGRILKTNGNHLELQIAEELSIKGYSIQKNVVFYFADRTFEIDIIAYTKEELLFISCKDRSSVIDRAQAEKFLHLSIYMLFFVSSICQIHFSQLYFRANPTYSRLLKNKYHKTIWGERVQVFIID